MATFTVIDAASAPKPNRQAGALAARMAEYDGYVAGVKKGQVGKLQPAANESPRGLALRVSRAGKRLGKPVDTWVVDGVLYFRVA